LGDGMGLGKVHTLRRSPADELRLTRAGFLDRHQSPSRLY